METNYSWTKKIIKMKMRVRNEVEARQRVRLEMTFGLKNKFGVEKEVRD